MRCSEQDSGWLWLFVVAILVQPMIADMVKREPEPAEYVSEGLPKLEIREPRL